MSKKRMTAIRMVGVQERARVFPRAGSLVVYSFHSLGNTTIDRGIYTASDLVFWTNLLYNFGVEQVDVPHMRIEVW